MRNAFSKSMASSRLTFDRSDIFFLLPATTRSGRIGLIHGGRLSQPSSVHSAKKLRYYFVLIRNCYAHVALLQRNVTVPLGGLAYDSHPKSSKPPSCRRRWGQNNAVFSSTLSNDVYLSGIGNGNGSRTVIRVAVRAPATLPDRRFPCKS
jgi:hypothetical protein